MDQLWQSSALIVLFVALLAGTSFVQALTNRNYGRFGNPYLWFVPLWLVQAVVLLFPLFDFGFPTSWRTIGYIAVCHAALALGVIVAMIFGRHTGGGAAPLIEQRPQPRLLLIGLVIACVAQFMLSIDTLLSSSIAVADRLDGSGLDEARAENFQLATSFLGPLVAVFLVLASLTVFLAPMYSFAVGARMPWTRGINLMKILFYLSIFLLMMDALFIRVGRFPVLIVLVIVVIARGLGRQAAGIQPRNRTANAVFYNPIRTALLVVLLTAASVGAASLQEVRSGRLDPDQQIQAAYAVTIKPEARDIFGSSKFSSFYMLQILYLTSSFNVLSAYVDTAPQDLPPPFLGAYNFGHVYRAVGRLVPGYDPEFWIKDRAELFSVIERQDRLGNTWGTILRDFAADFTYPGTIVVMFLLGIFSQMSTDIFYRRRGFLDVSLLTLIRIVILFSAFHSLLFVAIVGWPVVIAAVTFFVSGLFVRREIPRRLDPVAPTTVDPLNQPAAEPGNLAR